MKDYQLTKLIYKILGKEKVLSYINDYNESYDRFLENLPDILPNSDYWEDTFMKYYSLIFYNIENLKKDSLNPLNFIPYKPKKFKIIYNMDFTETGVVTFSTVVNSSTAEMAKMYIRKSESEGDFSAWDGEEISREVNDYEGGNMEIKKVYVEGTKLTKHSRMLNENADSNAFIPQEVFIFKKIQKDLQELRTKDKIIEKIKEILDYMGFDPLEAMAYYYLFTINYRKDGRYDLTKKSEKKQLQDLKSVKTSNVNAAVFANSKIPFKGSNLEGIWENDYNGVPQYIISSYGWYPIFIFKNNEWYQVNDSYSRSTSKQMNKLNVKLDKKLFTKGEMNAIRVGRDPNSLKIQKYKDLIDYKESFINKKMNRKMNFDNLRYSIPELTNLSERFGKVDFVVKDIKLENDLPVFYVDILKAGVAGSTGGYLNRQYSYPSPVSKAAEKTIEGTLQNLYQAELSSVGDMSIVFNHINAVNNSMSQDEVS